MTYMLAEEDAEPPFGLTSTIRWIGCETTEEVDDILIRVQSGHSGVVQAKRTITLSTQRIHGGKLTPFASAIDQCVRYYRARRQATERSPALDPAHDRIVLLVGAESPATVQQTLRRVVARLRSQPAGEPLFAPTLNTGEQGVLTRLLDRVRESWSIEEGHAPSDADVHEFLRFLYIEPAGVEEGEQQEREAKRILRSNVLGDPNQAEQAWNTLLTVASSLLTERASIGREELVQKLTAAGIRVRAPRSYRADIERLREHSAKILERLGDSSYVQLGAARVQLDRPYAEALQAAAADGSVLVIGEPGIGKSGVLYTAAKALAVGGDVVVLAAQDPPFSTLGQLRSELRLDHDVAEVLENWPGLEPAFLFVDALDAARTDASGQALRRLMSHVVTGSSRWRVIASIREYDARYGRDLRRTFVGASPPGPLPPLTGPAFQNLRHLVVGRLTDEELAQLSAKSPALHALVSTAPLALAGLFSNVFNLRLAAELLESGTEPEAIRAAGSQLQLLDLYWGERVLGGGEPHESHAREAVLRLAVQGMVQDRALRVDWDRVAADPSASPALSDLLHAHVLTEWAPVPGASPDGSALTFAHHVLFDYAVARVFFRVSPRRLAELLVSDPSLVLLARPSLVLHFHYLWHRGPDSREPFWESVLLLCGTAGIPEIGRLIGPGVAAELADTFEALSPLTRALKERGAGRGAAENALGHLIRAVIAEERAAGVPLATDVWCRLAEALSSDLRSETAYPLQWLLSILVEQFKTASPDQQVRLGLAARRLLEFAWGATTSRDRGLITYAIQHVSRTFSSDLVESPKLLRRALEPEHLAAYGSEEMFWIADQVTTLLEHDADLVRDIYVAAFGHRETSDSTTSMGGIVLQLTSTRRQDYELALFGLKQAFPQFLEQAPEAAVVALNAAVEAHFARERSLGRAHEELTFDFQGSVARFLPDHSGAWDRGGGPDDEALEMLEQFQSHLEDVAQKDGSGDELRLLISTMTRECRLAAIWRRLLEAGSRHPDTVGLNLRELAWTPAILLSHETSYAAGDFIRAVLPHLSPEERIRVEEAVLAIPDQRPAGERDWAEHDRDRLLGCMAEPQPLTDRARERLVELQAADEVPSNTVEGPSFSWGAGGYGEANSAGGKAANKRLHDYTEPVRKFASQLQNGTPDVDAGEALLPRLQDLRRAITIAVADDADSVVLSDAWDQLADACSTLAELSTLRCSEETGAFVRAVLLEASEHPEPHPAPDADARFTHPSWGRPAARIVAAGGILCLASNAECADAAVLGALDRLSRDPDPAVRYQVISAVHRLKKLHAEHCWDIIERTAAEEPSWGVLLGLVQGPLDALRFEAPERVMLSVVRVFERLGGRDDAKEVRGHSVKILAWMYLWKDLQPVRDIIGAIADHPLRHLDAATHLVRFLRRIVIHGPTDGSEPQADRARERGLDLLLRTTRAARRAFQSSTEGEPGLAGEEASYKLSTEEIHSLAQILDGVGAALYFESGAYKGNKHRPVAEAVQARLLAEAVPIIDELAEVGLARLAHHLFETLEELAPYKPHEVFLRIAAVIRGGRKSGYQYDRMAEKVLVRTVERYLADYRGIFQEDEQLRRALVEVLDTFVGAGSQGARRLTYGLAEIFR
jgi:hypothetical protein